MLKSMTGFGAGDGGDEAYLVRVEIRSVNQRFLELAFHMPRTLYPWEGAMRKAIKARVARGKLDVQVSFRDLRENAAAVRLDRGLALAYHKALNELGDLLHMVRSDDPCAIASYPGVLALEEGAAPEGIETPLLAALGEALARMDGMRHKEGEHIARDFGQRLERLERWTGEAEALQPGIVKAYRTRVEKTVRELLADESMDDARILQEVAIYADKVNYTEEIVRLRSHLGQFRAILQEAEEPVGRKLDFLIQELNRETNTIGSKASDAAAARIVVDMKSEIEKLREQVQNIE